MQANDKNNINVLFIGFVWPEVTSTAASQNIVSYLQTFIEAGYQVHFACAAQKSPLSTNLADFGVSTHEVLLNSDCFDQLVLKIAPNLVVFDRFLTEEQFGWRVMKAAPDALRVMDCEDLHFLRNARHQLYKSTGYQPQNPIYLRGDAVLQTPYKSYLYNDLTTREMASIYRCDLVITLSSFERDILLSHFNLNPRNVLLLPYLVNETQQQTTKIQSLREDFISIGNFRHAPNIDAVNILIQHLWPAIFKALPKTKCHIYGAYLPPRIQQLHNPKRGIHIHGHVDDHFAVLQSARVLLAPIQFGAGVKGKIVDSLRCGLPSITTPIGCEGIRYTRWPGAVVNDRDKFVQSAIDTYHCTEQQLATMQQNMKQIIKENFDTQNHRQILLTTIKQRYSQLKIDRQSNFLQQLVSHHSLQTHQYMSQWISAKNALLDTKIQANNAQNSQHAD